MGPYIGIFAAETVLTLKRKYPDITLGCVIAFEEQAARFSAALHERYYAVLEQCDIETMVGRRFSKNSMQNHFRYMIDRSDILVAIWDGKQSQRRMANAAKYAEDNHIKVIRIDPYYNI